MTDVKIILEGKQGSGKSRLQSKLIDFLLKEGFTVKTAVSPDAHGFTIVEPMKVLNK